MSYLHPVNTTNESKYFWLEVQYIDIRGTVVSPIGTVHCDSFRRVAYDDSTRILDVRKLLSRELHLPRRCITFASSNITDDRLVSNVCESKSNAPFGVWVCEEDNVISISAPSLADVQRKNEANEQVNPSDYELVFVYITDTCCDIGRTHYRIEYLANFKECTLASLVNYVRALFPKFVVFVLSKNPRTELEILIDANEAGTWFRSPLFNQTLQAAGIIDSIHIRMAQKADIPLTCSRIIPVDSADAGKVNSHHRIAPHDDISSRVATIPKPPPIPNGGGGGGGEANNRRHYSFPPSVANIEEDNDYKNRKRPHSPISHADDDNNDDDESQQEESNSVDQKTGNSKDNSQETKRRVRSVPLEKLRTKAIAAIERYAFFPGFIGLKIVKINDTLRVKFTRVTLDIEKDNDFIRDQMNEHHTILIYGTPCDSETKTCGSAGWYYNVPTLVANLRHEFSFATQVPFKPLKSDKPLVWVHGSVSPDVFPDYSIIIQWLCRVYYNRSITRLRSVQLSAREWTTLQELGTYEIAFDSPAFDKDLIDFIGKQSLAPLSNITALPAPETAEDATDDKKNDEMDDVRKVKPSSENNKTSTHEIRTTAQTDLSQANADPRVVEDQKCVSDYMEIVKRHLARPIKA